MKTALLLLALAALLLSAPILAAPITIDMVTVGDAGNVADTTGYGAVGYEYRIGKYEVTIGQYTEFLNSVASQDPYALYDDAMASNPSIAGISRSGTSGAYVYAVLNNGGNSANRPIAYINWFDAARFANWMANGQGAASTESGAYTLNGAVSGTPPARNGINPNTGEAPAFWIPLETEWYKAAYFSPALNDGAGGYFSYATQSNAAPGNVVGGIPNQANYRDANGVYSLTQTPNFSLTQNYLADVGAYSASASYYGTFDQTGSVWEWTDAVDGSLRTLRGGVWDSVGGSSQQYSVFNPAATVGYDGFRLAAPVAVPEPSTRVMGLIAIACGGWIARRKRSPVNCSLVTAASCLILALAGIVPAHAVTIDLVTVGDPGNAADTTGYGAVGYEYRIGKYEVTIGQYTEFLNAVAKQDTYALYSVNLMSTSDSGGIVQTGSPGSYFYYATISDYYRPIPQATAANRPISNLSWWQAARFANWMSNGQPTGAQSVSTTENGAYALNGTVSGTAPAVNLINPTTGLSPSYRLPTENEWYKAAYYKGGSTNAGYWDYATQSDVSPGNTPGSGSNQANYWNGKYSVTQSSNLLGGQNHLTDVGAFSASPSAYGTFDQSGNALELNDLTGGASLARGRRGGDWSQNWAEVSSFVRYEYQGNYGGFRLAAPVAVPEPSTWLMGLAGLVCGACSVRRRAA